MNVRCLWYLLRLNLNVEMTTRQYAVPSIDDFDIKKLHGMTLPVLLNVCDERLQIDGGHRWKDRAC
mgnify:CR=1 FL=1